jgi:iron complex transport system ATP-binding protein
MSDPAIHLYDLRFAYRGDKHVVDGVTAAAGAGRVVAMLGPNGSGKTTLLKLMLGELRPATGHVSLGGQELARVPAAERAAKMAYVPQRSAVTFAFTVAQVVSMGRHVLPTDRGAERRAMERCDLIELADRPMAELSVGQQQRVLVARAMAQAAGGGKVVLLDEPTSAMDLAHSHATFSLLRELGAEGLAVVAVMQDLNLAARYADDVWLLHAGKLAAAGSWERVLRAEVLEPVYGVKLRDVGGGGARPIFDVRD